MRACLCDERLGSDFPSTKLLFPTQAIDRRYQFGALGGEVPGIAARVDLKAVEMSGASFLADVRLKGYLRNGKIDAMREFEHGLVMTQMNFAIGACPGIRGDT